MKTIIFFFTFILSVNCFAQGDRVDYIYNGDTVVIIHNCDTVVLSREMFGLENGMCGEFLVSDAIGNEHGLIEIRVEDRILKFLGIKERDDEGKYIKKVADFWNANSQCFICTIDDNIARVRVPSHFMKKAIAAGYSNLIFDEFLLYPDYHININHIEYYNGTPETVLDYVNNIIDDEEQLKDYSKNTIVALQHQLINKGGKTAEEVLNEEKTKK